MNNVYRFALPVLLSAVWAHAKATGVAVQVSDSSGNPLADAVVTVVPESGPAVQRKPDTAVIEQRNLKFLPLVSVIQVGSSVSFPNSDKVRHHIYSFSPAKKFDQKLYSGTAAATQLFDREGVVVLGCNIHDRMIAYVKVVDTPFFARTDEAGVARIELPAAGKYKVTAWHYHMAGREVEQSALLKAGPDLPLTFKLLLKPPVDESDTGSSGY